MNASDIAALGLDKAQIVVYAADPNDEHLKPLNPSKPGAAYKIDDTGLIYLWNPITQQWV